MPSWLQHSCLLPSHINYFTTQLSLCCAVIPPCPHCHPSPVYLCPSLPSSFRQPLLPLSSHSHSGGIHSTVWHQDLLSWGGGGGGGVVVMWSSGSFVWHGTLEFCCLVCSRVRKNEGKTERCHWFPGHRRPGWNPDPAPPAGVSIRHSHSTAFFFIIGFFFLLCAFDKFSESPIHRLLCSHRVLVCGPCFQPLLFYCNHLSVLDTMRKMPTVYRTLIFIASVVHF